MTALLHLNMGRSKLPAAVKSIRGTSRKNRPQDDHVFDATTIVSLEEVNVPSHLNAEAKKVYKEVVAQLFAMKMLQPIDTTALCIYANAIATIAKMQKALDKEGYVTYIKDEDGNITGVTVNPMQKVLKDAINVATTIGAQFGWSPAARIKLASMLSKDGEEKDDFANLM